MKRILVFTLVVAALLALTVGVAAANTWLDKAEPEDLDNPNCWSFSAEAPGGWGGEWGKGAVTAHPDDTDDAGYCTLTVGSKARQLELRVLDGSADDSFDVYVMNPGGNWVLVYSYADQYSSETWVTHQIYDFPAGKGQGCTIEVKIMPTGPRWTGFDTYGQLAVDYVAAYSK